MTGAEFGWVCAGALAFGVLMIAYLDRQLPYQKAQKTCINCGKCPTRIER